MNLGSIIPRHGLGAEIPVIFIYQFHVNFLSSNLTSLLYIFFKKKFFSCVLASARNGLVETRSLRGVGVAGPRHYKPRRPRCEYTVSCRNCVERNEGGKKVCVRSSTVVVLVSSGLVGTLVVLCVCCPEPILHYIHLAFVNGWVVYTTGYGLKSSR